MASSRALSVRLDRELKVILARAVAAAQRIDPDTSEGEIVREALRRGLGMAPNHDQEGKNRAFAKAMKGVVRAVREEAGEDED